MAALDIDTQRRSISRNLGSLVTAWWTDSYRRGVLAGAGLSWKSTDTQVLWELGHDGPLRPGVLARRIGVGAPAVTKAVARLLERLCVQVEEDPTDRRATRVSITREGRRVLQIITEAGDALAAEAMADWSTEDVEIFARLVDRFARASLRAGAGQASSDHAGA